MSDTTIPLIGAACFGAVVGFLAQQVFQRAGQVDIKWLSSIIGVIGGAAVTTLFDNRSQMFGSYCIGLAAAFFFSLLASWALKLPAPPTPPVIPPAKPSDTSKNPHAT